MSLHNPPASILTHGGDSKKAIASTLATHTEHHDAAHPTIMAAQRGTPHTLRHMHYEEYAAPVEPEKQPDPHTKGIADYFKGLLK